jgi:hypothetical protein
MLTTTPVGEVVCASRDEGVGDDYPTRHSGTARSTLVRSPAPSRSITGTPLTRNNPPTAGLRVTWVVPYIRSSSVVDPLSSRSPRHGHRALVES